jgi:hypothetical protein
MPCRTREILEDAQPFAAGYLLCPQFMHDGDRGFFGRGKMGKLLTALIGLALLFSGGAARADEGTPCDRGCLTKVLDAYLISLVAGDSGSAPIATNYRHTENAIAIPRGKGLWANAERIGKVDRRYFDPVTGNAAFFGTIEMPDGEVTISSLLLHVSGSKADEAEWHVTRASDNGIRPGAPATFDAANFVKDPPPQWNIPAGEQLTRDELIFVTNSYFDGITNADASLIAGHPGCRRLENGLEVTGRPVEAGRTDGYLGRGDCMSGQGRFGVVNVAARRYPVVDVEQQTVLAIATFIRAPNEPRRRNHLMEYFYMQGGKIKDVYTAFFYPDATLPVPNWAPYDGNFPLPADFGATE